MIMRQMLAIWGDAAKNDLFRVPPGDFYTVPKGVDPQSARRQFVLDSDDEKVAVLYDKLGSIVERLTGRKFKKHSQISEFSAHILEYHKYDDVEGMDDVDRHYDTNEADNLQSSDDYSVVVTLAGMGEVVYPLHSLRLVCDTGSLVVHENNHRSLHYTENKPVTNRVVAGFHYTIQIG